MYIIYIYTPSGKRLHNYGTSLFSMGKSTISMAILCVANCKRLPEGIPTGYPKKPWKLLILSESQPEGIPEDY